MNAAAPSFDPYYILGDRVRVISAHPPGHRRTPHYIRGKEGVVERYCGAFPNPEERAYGFSGLPKRNLYRVRFRQMDIWSGYNGPVHDLLELEIFEHWLTRAEAS